MQSVNDAIKHATQDVCKHYFPPTKSPTMDFIAHGMLKQCIYCGKPYLARGFTVPRLDKKGKPIQHGASTSRNSYRPRTKQQILSRAELQPISIKETVE